ncbi:LysR substrate-binding domain-containing protein [Pseudomonas prosekii]|uniref:LysR substrate-binding domain-containing protein n=1 Tax=Pseudomonas prosekii TaxID=1148509 RepID=UPI0016568BA8|nr:LysR substrate-binding domain-containing protein [Pseudomonas prosekii]
MKNRIFKSLPSLVAIQSFVICAELRSINKASTLLHRSQGAISKQIKQLEEHYSVVLFERSIDGLKLTMHGQHFLSISKKLLEVLEQYETSEPNLPEQITISAPSTFTLRWLLPRIEKIKKDLNNQKIQINSTSQDLTLLNEGELEISIMRGHTKTKGVICTELFPEFLTPMCSESVMASIAESGLSLRGQHLLHASKPGNEWATWLECSKVESDVFTHSIFFDTLDVALSAAEASAGVVIGDPTMAVERLNSKRLVMPFSLIVPSGKRYYACYSESHSDNPAVVKLINLIKSQT